MVSFRILPWTPIARTTYPAVSFSPPASAISKLPRSPVIAVTSALSLKFTCAPSTSRVQLSITSSRDSSLKVSSLRNGRISGVAITCLCF
jgi:hypothetical protein